MRTSEQIVADAENRSPFSNSTEYEIWADSGKGCYDCRHDDANQERYCPILSVAFLGNWPAEWTRRMRRWEIGDASGEYEVVDECTEFDRRNDEGDDSTPEPEPPPEVVGQIDMFEVFADQITEQVSRAEQVTA